SWHVATAAFVDPVTLRAVLDVLLRDYGVAALSDPDTTPVLDGGLVLSGPGGEVLVEPGCCSDLGVLADWRAAASHRSSGWQMVWTGHPWVSVRYQEPWLVLSDPHESDSPAACWAFRPEQLERALSEAEAELTRFTVRLETALSMLDF